MANKDRCFKCGAHLLESTPHGLCPKCLMKVGFEEDVDATLEESSLIEGPGTRIGNYELLELVGEGGMGLVYLAEQKEPVKRKVALKIVKLGMDTKQVVARFEAERQTLAVLEHPNIAHVFDAGTTETGRPYFVMEYVEGRSITKYCDEQKLSVKGRLELFKQVCEGVHHAHQKGIIHRDIKPSNILVSVRGEQAVPKIIDFGIAKAITQPLSENTSFTEHGQLLGTPEYMSPEQAEMAYQDVDTRSDVYSLGVVLYELLTGATPFDAKRLRNGGIDQIKRVICEEEPETPSARLTSLGDKARTVAESRKTQIITLARRLHRELEWIPMKAMRKDRTRRYRSASELADDIQNYLNGVPLIAGPESNAYRARKFVRKHAGFVASAALVAVVIVLGLIASTVFSFKAEKARGQEAAARTQAEQARTAAEEQSEEYRRLLYVHQIALADASWRDGNAERTQELLEACPNDLRGWEWNRLNHISDQSVMTIEGADHGIRSAVLSPDGKFIVSNGWGPTIKLWDAEHGTELKTLSGHEDTVLCVDLSQDGKQIASGGKDKTIRLWDVETGREVATLRGHSKAIQSVRFSPDGKRIASAESKDIIKIWDCPTGKEMRTIQVGGSVIVKPHYLGGLAFSPDGKHIASGCNGDIRIWDVDSGADVLTIAGSHITSVPYVAYSPDGKQLVSSGGGDPRIRIWDAATGEETMSLKTRNSWINYVNYDSTGKYIVSSAMDNTIDTWEVSSGENLMTLRGHHGSIQSAAFSADGSRIISSGDDKTIKLWDIPSPPEQFFIQTPSLIRSIWFSPDGRRFATAGSTWAALTLWDTMTGVELLRLGNAHVWACAFSPDGKHIVLSQGNCPAKIWDVETGEQQTVLRGHDYSASAIAYSPDGSRIASSNRKNIKKIIGIWDAATGAELMRLQDNEARDITSLTFSLDGSRLISCGEDDIIRVWDVASGKRILAIEQEGQTGSGIAIRSDGKVIASAGSGEIHLLDATDGKQLMILRGHNRYVTSVSFSPVADRLVSCGGDNTIKVWDTTTGMELMTLVSDAYFDVTDVAFSPDGSTIAATGREGIILWETKEPVGGLDPRRNAQTARQLVKRLYQEYGTYYDVRDQLSGDDKCDESVREIALQIVDTRIPEEACDVAWNVLATIVPFKRDKQEYQAALVKLEKANRLAPDESLILKAIGAVQCRLGSYEEALKNLTKSAQMGSDSGTKFDPLGLAFKAMALQKIGQTEEAKGTLEQLRENLDMTGAGWRWGVPIFQALLPELEELIEDSRRGFSDGELVVHWTFDEVNNGEVLDSTGKGLHGKLIGNAQIVSDAERGSVLKLPGKGDYVDCGWNSALDITGDITIAAWIKVTELDSRWEEIVSTDNYGLGLSGYKEDPNHVGPGYWYKDDVWIEKTLDVDNQWHLIVVLYDGQELALYIDGKLCSSKRVYQSIVMDTGPLYIGQTREGYNNEGWKDQLIDDVRIYSYALSPEEVKMLYEGKEPPREKRLAPQNAE